jgi:hypothetical protein
MSNFNINTILGARTYRAGTFTDVHTFTKDGKVVGKDPKNPGKWSHTDNLLVVNWDNGWVNTYTRYVAGVWIGTAQQGGSACIDITLS